MLEHERYGHGGCSIEQGDGGAQKRRPQLKTGSLLDGEPANAPWLARGPDRTRGYQPLLIRVPGHRPCAARGPRNYADYSASQNGQTPNIDSRLVGEIAAMPIQSDVNRQHNHREPGTFSKFFEAMLDVVRAALTRIQV